MGGVVAQPSNGISKAVKHNAEIHSDITGIILRLITPHSSLEPTVRAPAADCPGRGIWRRVLTTSLLHRFPILKGSFDRTQIPRLAILGVVFDGGPCP